MAMAGGRALRGIASRLSAPSSASASSALSRCASLRGAVALRGWGPTGSGSAPVRFKMRKTGGSTKNTHDSPGQRLGVKKFGGERVVAGNIIIRQRGTEWHPGRGVGIGRDHTLYALGDGHVRFEEVLWKAPPIKRKRWRRFVHVVSTEEHETALVKKYAAKLRKHRWSIRQIEAQREAGMTEEHRKHWAAWLPEGARVPEPSPLPAPPGPPPRPTTEAATRMLLQVQRDSGLLGEARV